MTTRQFGLVLVLVFLSAVLLVGGDVVAPREAVSIQPRCTVAQEERARRIAPGCFIEAMRADAPGNWGENCLEAARQAVCR